MARSILFAVILAADRMRVISRGLLINLISAVRCEISSRLTGKEAEGDMGLLKDEKIFASSSGLIPGLKASKAAFFTRLGKSVDSLSIGLASSI